MCLDRFVWLGRSICRAGTINLPGWDDQFAGLGRSICRAPTIHFPGFYDQFVGLGQRVTMDSEKNLLTSWARTRIMWHGESLTRDQNQVGHKTGIGKADCVLSNWFYSSVPHSSTRVRCITHQISHRPQSSGNLKS